MVHPKTSGRFVVIVVALAVLTGAAHYTLGRRSTGPLRERVEKDLTRALGLEVTIDELMVALLPTPHLHAEGVRVANIPGRTSPYLLSIHRVDLEVAFWPLFARDVVIDGLTIAGADLHIDSDGQGRIASDLQLGTPAMHVDKKSLAFELRRLKVETARVFYQNPQSGASHTLQLDSLALKSKRLRGKLSLEAHGEFEGSKISLSGESGSLLEFLNPTRPFPVDLEGQFSEARFEARGSIREPSTLAGLELEISAEIPELVVSGQSLPQLGVIRLGGQLSNLDESLGLEQIRLDTTKTDPVRIDVRGRIGDLLELDDVDIETDIETRSLDFLEPLLQPRFGFPLPVIASLSAKTRLSHEKEGLTLDGTLHATTTGDAIVMNAKGSARDLTRIPKLDVRLDARAHDLASITAFIPERPKHGALGPVAASARLKSQRGGLGATGIEIRVGDRQKAWVELDGSVGDLAARRDVEIDLAFGAESLHHLIELLESELPSTSPIRGTAAISDKDGSLGLEHLHLHGGENSPVEIHLDARFDDLKGRDAIEVDLKFRSDDTRVLAALGGVDLPVLGPVEFRGNSRGFDKHVDAENVRLRLGETQLDGSLSGSFAS